jgi:hypothetical protein
MKSEIKMLDYRTLSYRGFKIKVTPELIQDVQANNVSPEEFEKHLHDIYMRNIHIIRNDKINQILEECNASKK